MTTLMRPELWGNRGENGSRFRDGFAQRHGPPSRRGGLRPRPDHPAATGQLWPYKRRREGFEPSVRGFRAQRFSRPQRGRLDLARHEGFAGSVIVMGTSVGTSGPRTFCGPLSLLLAQATPTTSPPRPPHHRLSCARGRAQGGFRSRSITTGPVSTETRPGKRDPCGRCRLMLTRRTRGLAELRGPLRNAPSIRQGLLGAGAASSD
jgi:hypothetical protein